MRSISSRLVLVGLLVIGLMFSQPALADDLLPVGSALRPLELPWFPTRLHAFVWRNWELADLSRMAEVLGTTPDKVRALGEAMGLPAYVPPTDTQRRRSYITLIRRNWHLLSYAQLLRLLDWTPQHLADTLREDDFLWVKLGSLKPACPALSYAEPDEAARRRSAEIKALLEAQLGEELNTPAQPRFAFVEQLSRPGVAAPASRPADAGEPIRLIYSYFAVYGDPLIDPELDPYPDGLLERLAAQGVNAVWIHTVLRDLAGTASFPEFGAGHETRLANLRRLVARARRYGISVFLYINEPRAMPAGFFASRPDLAGTREGDLVAMCTSAPIVRQWLMDALAYVFRQVPDLGGVFTITASENLTNCASHSGQGGCLRCAKRTGAQIVADVNSAIAEGVRRGNPNARVIVWDWGWPDAWAEEIIAALPAGVRLMSVSEWNLPIERGGIRSQVGEYSLSAVGPGPRAQRHWRLAQARGLRPMAKMQLNCSWELSAVPCLPVLDLVARHCENVRQAGVTDLMLSWTVGGYPSMNLHLASEVTRRPDATADAILQALSEERYGQGSADSGRKAWAAFSRAFTEYPYHASFLYSGPMQCGPANPLYPQPTGFRASMVGIPYDDVDGWRGVYPPDVLAGQLGKVAAGWKTGLSYYDEALAGADSAHRPNLEEDRRLAEAALLHVQSAAAQVRFTIARNVRRSPGLADADARKQAMIMRESAEQELLTAKRLYVLAKADPRIGFEASNHYYYLPVDLLEKVVNCEFAIRQVLRARADGSQP